MFITYRNADLSFAEYLSRQATHYAVRTSKIASNKINAFIVFYFSSLDPLEQNKCEMK